MARELTFPEAIKKVLSQSATPLHYQEITKRIITEGLKTSVGATPSASVNAHIASSIKRDGPNSPYIRVGKGIFALSTPDAHVPTISVGKLTPTVDESIEQEEQYDIVTSLGMYWRREAVDWNTNARLLGMQELGAIPVDFNRQLGIYMLYDGREIIYVEPIS